MITRGNLIKIKDYLWEIPMSFRPDMRVPARLFANEEMLADIIRDRSLEQLVNVATLPGIQKEALAMPDIHEGYGFPIGGVAATLYPRGVISPGGIGYDINCGVRLLLSSLTHNEIYSVRGMLAHKLFRAIPSGVGRGGEVRLPRKELNSVLQSGIQWALDNGFAQEDDCGKIESEGKLPEANPDKVSEQAKKRGHDQLGTIGSGNHFVEVDVVSKIFDEKVAEVFGLRKDQIVVLIHTGSRGLGHQVATDYIRIMMQTMPKYGITLPDRELACAPFSSKEGSDYFQAMCACANFAWVNRQMITWEARKVWEDVFGKKEDLKLLYDVAHNIAKIEEHEIGGEIKKVILHRKGATRAFPGQPVLIPGSMGTASYVLVGTQKGMRESFGSSCHGAGRLMSRHAAKRKMQGKVLLAELEKDHITIQTGSVRDLPEEAPYAYKNIDSVVDVVDSSGIAKKVAMLKPVVVIKG